MKAQSIHSTNTLYRSEARPDVCTECPKAAEAIAWADANMRVWQIVTSRRSKAFGLGSCVYIGWAQKSMAPEAILERVEHLHRLATGTEPHLSPNHIQCWAARFTFERFRERGFTGGFFQQHDDRHARLCMTLDYTPETLPDVVDRFLLWCGNLHHTARVTVNGETVRTPGGPRHG